MNDTNSAGYKNRIVETRMVDASELIPHPLNPRRHPQTQQEAVRGLVSSVGIVDSLTVYDSPTYGPNTVIDGHLRKDLGGVWPVSVIDVTDEEALLILSVFDYTTSLAELDGAALAELLGRVEMTPVEDDGVRELLAQLAAAHVPEVARADVDSEPQIDRAEELRIKWGVKSGDLWGMGKHTICPKCGKRHELK